MASAEKQNPISAQEDDEIDPVEEMIKKTGCIKYHYAVQDCMMEHEDWRKCQDAVTEFKQCMSSHYMNKKKATKS